MNQNVSQDLIRSTAEGEGLKIDFKRVLFRALKHWYLILISLVIGLTAAYIKNRYAQYIYPVNASIIIRESKETGSGELLYQNAIVAPDRNYFNELYIIRSYPLIQSVLEELNFGVSFFREGNIITSELYDYPVSVQVLNTNQVKSCEYNFTPVNENEFRLQPSAENTNLKPSTFLFGDTILYNGARLVMQKSKSLVEHLNQTVVFRYVAPEYITGMYVGKLGARWAEEGAGVIDLNVSGLIPQKEIDFLNGFIRMYQRYDLHRKNQIANRTIEFINKQIQDISDSLRQVETNIQNFKGRNIVTDLSAETNRLYSQMESADLQQTELTVREKYYQYLEDYVRQDKNLDLVILPSSIGITDGVVGGFVNEMVDLELSLKLMMDKEKLDNPLIRERRLRLQEIKNNILETVRGQRNTDKIRQDAVNKRVRVLEQRLSYLPEAERQYTSIRRNFSLLEGLYVYLLQKRSEASISQAASISDVVVINPPMAGGPISPKPTTTYLLAGLLGFAFPIFIIVILEILNVRIQSKDDIEKYTSIPFIGGVGHKAGNENNTVATAPKSAVAESFRALRSNLTYFLGDKKRAVILITSSISGEGKTFTTINLATILALSGKKTLIVGADLRKPKLFSDFNLENDKGLSSYLAGLNSFDEVLQPTGKDNLDLVSGGPVPPNPSELVLSMKMEDFLRQARERYDYVIIDSPPLAIVADAFLLADHADHMIFVTRQDYTPKSLLRSVNEYYTTGRLKNISILLNDIFKSGPGYGYGYNYGYGYGYGYGKRKNGHGYYE